MQSDQARFARYASLVGKGDVPRQDYDDARFKMAADQARSNSAKQQAEVQLARLGGNADVDVTTMPAYQQAQASSPRRSASSPTPWCARRSPAS